MPGEALANDIAGFLVGDHIIELQPNPLQGRWACMDEHGIIIVQGAEIVDIDFDNGIDEPALFDFAVGIGGVAHQRGAAELEIAQVIGMVNDLRPIGIHIKSARLTTVPDLFGGFVPHIMRCIGIGLCNERCGSQSTPL